jgi:tetratricopeptide (TPR) repeat protein
VASNSNNFISYSWKNEALVDEIDNYFKRIGIIFIRDKRDLGYYNQISGFMKRVRDCDYLLMVISADYLKSRNCMYEIWEFQQEKNYEKRLLPVRLEDAQDILTKEGQIKYIRYWENEAAKAKALLNKIDPLNAKELIEECRIKERICRYIGEFLAFISDLNHPSFNELKAQNYRPVLDFIGYQNAGQLAELLEIGDIASFEEQEIQLDQFSDKYGKTSDYYFMRAYIAAENNNFKIAKYNYDEASKINPDSCEVHYNLAILLADPFNDYDEAKSHYLKALKINPDYYTAHYNLAILLEDHFNDYDGAKFHYLETLKINPDYCEVHNNLALLLADHFNDYDEAKSHFLKALKINPEDCDVHSNLALLLADHFNDYDEAKFHFLKALQIGPEDSSIWCDLGNVLDNLNQFPDAIDAYKKAIEIDPNYALAWYSLANSHMQTHNKDLVKQFLQKATEIDPSLKETAKADEDFKEFWDDDILK